MSQPLVSVVIPAFNAGLTLAETVASALAQTHRAIEVLIVDDGSADDTGEQAQALAMADQRVKVLRHQGGANRGVAASRNLGIETARGEFIAFLDADDLWLEGKLERQIAHFASLGMCVGAVCCAAANVAFEPGADWRSGAPLPESRVALFDGSPGQALRVLLLTPDHSFHNHVPSPSMLVRRDVFDAGLRFIGPPRLNVQFEDYLAWLMIATRHEIIGLDEVLCVYRVHQHQFVSRYGLAFATGRYLCDIDEMLAVLVEECPHAVAPECLRQKKVVVLESLLSRRGVQQPMWSEFLRLLRFARRAGATRAFLRTYLGQGVKQISRRARRILAA